MDSTKGPLIRGRDLKSLLSDLPQRDSVPIPEAMFWYLLTGEIPTIEDTVSLIEALDEKSALPAETLSILESFPHDFPPIALLSIAILSLNHNSKFNSIYADGEKNRLWEGAYEDSLDILAKMTPLLGYIYCKRHGFEADLSVRGSMSSRFCKLVGGENSLNLLRFVRLFLTIYADSDTGSASSQAAKLISSTLSDPYKAVSGSLNAVGGHLHGKAMQDSIEWIIKSSTFYKTQALQDIKDGKAIPGFGHANLLVPDPRYEIIKDFFSKTTPNHPMLKRVEEIAETVPELLKGKVRDPHVNGDFIAGACLFSMGVEDVLMGPCLFGLARTLGCLSNVIWDRATGVPIIYTNSIDLKGLEQIAKKSG
jgi:citrate synthase